MYVWWRKLPAQIKHLGTQLPSPTPKFFTKYMEFKAALMSIAQQIIYLSAKSTPVANFDEQRDWHLSLKLMSSCSMYITMERRGEEEEEW
jgi:hypothetical protein